MIERIAAAFERNAFLIGVLAVIFTGIAFWSGVYFVVGSILK